MKGRMIAWLLLVFGLPHQDAKAQAASDSTIYHIETHDGNSFFGKRADQKNDTITLITSQFGKIHIPSTSIKNIKPIKSERIINGKYWFENPQSTRYFWAPNGYGLKKGEAYYQNVWIFFNQAVVGVTNHFSIGAGIVPMFIFGGGAPTPIYVTPKFSIPVVKDHLNVGIGALWGTVVGNGEGGSGSTGLVYGTTTFGTRDTNLSIGLGYGYSDGNFSDAPVINISAMVRTGQRSYFMTENYFLGLSDENIIMILLGGRSIIKRVSIDYGAFIPIIENMSSFAAVPWLGITVPLGKPSG